MKLKRWGYQEVVMQDYSLRSVINATHDVFWSTVLSVGHDKRLLKTGRGYYEAKIISMFGPSRIVHFSIT